MAKKSDETLSFIEQLKKDLKDDSIGISKLSDPSNDIIREPTGILALDNICGGGFPKGRWIEIFGMESSGKSLLATLVCAHAQKKGDMVAWIDMERTADNKWFARLGVDTDKMLVIKPTSAEGAFKALNTLIDSGKISYIVLDSVASMATEKEIEEEPGKQNMAVMARLLSTEMRKLTGKLDSTKTTVILINQIRSAMAATAYAKQNTTTGGKAIGFYASLRLWVKKLTDPSTYIEDRNGERLAHSISIRVEKNKVGSPGKTGSFMLIYDGGPDNRTAIIGMALQAGIITKNMAMYYLDVDGQSISARGERALLEKIQQSPKIQKYLLSALHIDPTYADTFESDKRELAVAEGLATMVKLPEDE